MNRLSLIFPSTVFTLVAMCVSSAGIAQQKQGIPDQVASSPSTKSNEVTLPVTVRDKHGALVTTLQKSDFTLTEDGRAEVIQSLDRDPNLPFQLGFLVETNRSMMGAIDLERKAAGRLADQMLPGQPGAEAAKTGADKSGSTAPNPKDQAFLIHFDREVELLQDFTGSREKLHSELDEMGPSTQMEEDRNGPETTGEDRERPRGGRDSSQLYDAIYLASDEVMKPKNGHKALIIFSDGVDRGSKESMTDALDAAERANVTIYAVYFKGEQERTNSGFPGMGRRGGMGGGYPGGGYPGGGGGYPGGGGGRRGGESKPAVDGKKIMEQIAVRTGGRYFDTKKKEDLDEIYGLIGDELRGQYLLTFTPDKPDNDGSFHKITLKADKDDLTVVTRDGFFAPGGDSN